MSFKNLEKWEEVKDFKTLAKVKSVEEMVPVPAANQIAKWNAAKIWEEQYVILEECLRMDGTIEEACILAGISVASYYHHRDTNPDFARRMDIARQFPKMIARAAVQRRIRQWDSKTAMDFLKLRDRRYKDEPVIEEWEETKTPVIQFISVPSNEWQKNSQMSTEQKSASEWYANSSEAEKLTPWENEEEALRNIDLLNFSNE